MGSMVEIQLRQSVLERYGLPDMAYPVPSDVVRAALVDSDEIPWAALLYGLQVTSERQNGDWQRLEPAMARMAEILAPVGTKSFTTAAGDDWWLEIGPVELTGRIVTIQRAECLIAAIVPREDGRLRVAAYRPLDAKSARSLVALATTPHPEDGVCMRENNWEYALDCSAGNGNFYAAIEGAAYLSYLESALGIHRDGTESADWRAQVQQPPRAVTHVAIELGAYYVFADDEIV